MEEAPEKVTDRRGWPPVQQSRPPGASSTISFEAQNLGEGGGSDGPSHNSHGTAPVGADGDFIVSQATRPAKSSERRKSVLHLFWCTKGQARYNGKFGMMLRSNLQLATGTSDHVTRSYLIAHGDTLPPSTCAWPVGAQNSRKLPKAEH